MKKRPTGFVCVCVAAGAILAAWLCGFDFTKPVDVTFLVLAALVAALATYTCPYWND